MGDRPTIAFRVDESQKAKWETAAESNPEYDSLSHLIRLAVAHELSDAYGRANGTETASSVEGIGDVQAVLNRLEGRFEDVEDSLKTIEEGVYSDATTLSDDTVKRVFDRLPHSSAMTATEVASREKLSERRASMALEVLYHDTGNVERKVTEGEDVEVAYYRRTSEDEAEALATDEPPQPDDVQSVGKIDHDG